MRGCFYGPHHNDVWDHAESCLDLPPGNWWRLYTNRRGDVLLVTNATQHHHNFLKALREIVQQYPELPDAIEFDGSVESVRELLSRPKQRIEDVTFLHGTTDAFLDDILARGLRPRSETNVCPSYGARYNAPAGRCDWIYLTTQHNVAAMAARDAARQHGGVPIVLAVGPGLRSSYAEIDEDSSALTVEQSLALLGNIAYRRVISPELIRVHEKLVNHTTWQKVGTLLRYKGAEYRVARPAYVYSGWSCPAGPAEFVDWLVDRGQTIDYQEFAQNVDVTTAPLDDWQIEILPTDWAVTFLKTELPSGAPAFVLQHSGIEHLFLPPSVDYYDEAQMTPDIMEWLTDTFDISWASDATLEQIREMRERFFRG